MKSEHAERMGETYPEPLSYLAVDLLNANRRAWMHGKPEIPTVPSRSNATD